MRTNWYWGNKYFLLRQAIAAWVFLFVGVLLFTVIATIFSLVFKNQEIIIILSFILVVPLLVLSNIVFTKNQNKHMQNLVAVKALNTVMLELSNAALRKKSTSNNSSTDTILDRFAQDLDELQMMSESLVEKYIEELKNVDADLAMELKNEIDMVLKKAGEKRVDRILVSYHEANRRNKH